MRHLGRAPTWHSSPRPPLTWLGHRQGSAVPPGPGPLLPPLFTTFPRQQSHSFKDINTCTDIFRTPNLGYQAWRRRRLLFGSAFSMTQETGDDQAPRSNRDLLMSSISSPQLTALSFPLYNPHDFDSFPSASWLVGEKRVPTTL